jgi:hypothetical protein
VVINKMRQVDLISFTNVYSVHPNGLELSCVATFQRVD